MSRRTPATLLLTATIASALLTRCATGSAPPSPPDLAADRESMSDAVWYEETRAWIDALRLHVSTHGPESTSALRALELLESCVDDIERVQAAGTSPGDVPLLRTICDTQLRLIVQLDVARLCAAPAEVSP